MHPYPVTDRAFLAHAIFLGASFLSTALCLGPASPAVAGDVLPVSLAADPSLAADGKPTSHVARSSISDDGRFLVFTSLSGALAGTDENFASDVFLHDLQTGEVILVSRSTAGASVAGNDESRSPVISADGSTVAFESLATDLVAGSDPNGSAADVFAWDRASGQITLASRSTAGPDTTGNGPSSTPSLSGDGGVLVFVSDATDLVSGSDTNLWIDVFVWERATGTVRLASHVTGDETSAGNDYSSFPTISHDGGTVAFQSAATDLVAGFVDGNGGGQDVYAWDRATGTVELLSHATGDPSTGGDGESIRPVTSGDGSQVAFESRASNLASGVTDVNAREDVYLRERGTATTVLVSHVASDPTTSASFGHSHTSTISRDGGTVAFLSDADDLVSGYADGNPKGGNDIFAWDESTGVTTLVSHVLGSTTESGNRGSFSPRISADGGTVAFRSRATDLVDGTDPTSTFDVFLWHDATDAVSLASHSTGGEGVAANADSEEPVLSGDGTTVAFESAATDLVSDGAPGLYSTTGGVATLRSPSTGAFRTALTHSAPGDRAVSDDGRYVVFVNDTADPVSGMGDANGELFTDVFLWDRETQTATLVSHSTADPAIGGNGISSRPSISADGGTVVFQSLASDLVASDGNSTTDVFLWDRVTGALTLVSHKTGDPSTSAAGSSHAPAVSGDGSAVAFLSQAGADLAGGTDSNGTDDVYLWDRASGLVTLVSHQSASGTTAGNGKSDLAEISHDGGHVVFRSRATDLVAGFVSGGGGHNVYSWDRSTGTIVLVSRSQASATTGADATVGGPETSGDGSLVVFHSPATNLAPTDANGTDDVFLWEASTGGLTVVSRTATSATTSGDARSANPAISRDGGTVVFQSSAGDLVSGFVDGGGAVNVYAWDPATGDMTLSSHSTAGSTTGGDGNSTSPGVDAGGSTIFFASRAGDLVSGLVAAVDSKGLIANQVYLRDSATATIELASHVPASQTTTGNGRGFSPHLSADGGTLVFGSHSTDLVSGVDDRNLQADVFAHLVDPVSVDLRMGLGATAGPVFVGDPLVYTLEVENLSPRAAPRLLVSLALAPGSGFVGAAGSGWTCDEAGGAVACDLTGGLAAGATSTPITVDATAPPTPATAAVEASVRWPGPDPDPANDATSVATVVTVPPTADAGGPYAVVEDVALMLDGTASFSADPARMIVGYRWDADGDGTFETDGATVSVTFPSPGLYERSLEVTDDLGHTATDVATIDVADGTDPQIVEVDSTPGTGDGRLSACETTTEALGALHVVFDEALRSGGAGGGDEADNYRLLRPGPDHGFDTDLCGATQGDDEEVSFGLSSYETDTPTAGQSRATLSVDRRLLGGLHRLLVCGTILDLAGNPLESGVDTALDFRVDPGNLLPNGHFDCNVEGWSQSPSAGAVTWSAEDADPSPHSGSAHFPGSGGDDLALSTCLEDPIRIGGVYRFGGALRVDQAAGSGVTWMQSCTAYDALGCTGVELTTEVDGVLLGDTSGDFVSREIQLEMPTGAVSLHCEHRLESPESWDAYLDHAFLRIDLLVDGFESGDTSAWARTVQ